MKGFITTSLIIFGVCMGLCNAQTHTPPFKNITTENGLSSNFTRTIYSDKQGLIWVGTDTGLDSYDGLEITSYNKRFKTPLKGAVQSILENNDGSLWIGSEQGAFQYHRRENKLVPVDFKLPGINVRKIIRSSKNQVFFGTDKGLFQYDDHSNSASHIELNKKFRSKLVSITDIIEDERGNLWIGTFDGLYSYNPSNKYSSHTNITNQNLTNNIRCLLKANSDLLYIGTENGLFGYRFSTHTYKILNGSENAFILSLTRDKSQRIYIGTENEGLYSYSPEANTITPFQFNPTAIRSNLSIHALHCSDDMLWVGTFTEGIKQVDLIGRNIFKSIDMFNTYGIMIRCYYFDRDKTCYVGTRDGFAIFNKNIEKQRQFFPNSTPGLNTRLITTIFPYPGNDNALLLGTYGGGAVVFNKANNTFKDFTSYDVFRKGTVYKFAKDNHDNLWVGTLDGLYCYGLKTNALRKIDLGATMNSNEVFTLFLDKFNRLWAGTKLGAGYINLNNGKLAFPSICQKYKYQCTSIRSDKHNNIWFCFNKGGVLKTDHTLKSETWITTEIGMPENAPSSLVEDKDGNMWIGSQKGIFKVSKSGEIYTYGIEDGLNGLIICPESAYKDEGNNLWWANEFGLVKYSNEQSYIPPRIPHILLTDIYVNGNRYSADTLGSVKKINSQTYTINITGKTNNNVAIRFAALNYHKTKLNRYSYRLDESPWSKPKESGTITLNDLSVGHHKLQVVATNNDNNNSKLPIEVEVTITPRFYETNFFILVITLIIALTSFYLTRTYFVRLMNKIKLQFDEMKVKQTSTSVASHKVTEEKCLEIADKLNEYMKREKPYLNPELKQAEVAKAINYSVHEISLVLNVHIHSNFSDYINSFRVNELIHCIANGFYSHLNVSAIAQKCGFNSKTTFYRAFKKVTGLSPAEYFKGMKMD
ncbi:MAG TPA: two-component regulator propeller domain-containing protein [Paludibacter sp.]|nr:two-component regulator propeller domain-containing protein [Paludibacter sp.]